MFMVQSARMQMDWSSGSVGHRRPDEHQNRTTSSSRTVSVWREICSRCFELQNKWVSMTVPDLLSM